MAVAWGALSSAPQPGCLGHGHYASSWATMQGLHLQQMMFTSKGEAVLAGAAASQQSNARIAKSNRRSRYGEALPTFGFDDEMEGGSTLLSQLLSDVSFCMCAKFVQEHVLSLKLGRGFDRLMFRILNLTSRVIVCSHSKNACSLSLKRKVWMVGVILTL